MTNIPASVPPPLSSVKYSAGQPPAKSGNGSGWILAISVLQFVGGLIMFGMAVTNSPQDDIGPTAILITTMTLALVFFGLWLWGRKSPFPALLTALLVFVTFHLFDAVLDPMSLFRGIIVKIVVLVGLSSAVKKAYVAKRQKELESGAP